MGFNIDPAAIAAAAAALKAQQKETQPKSEARSEPKSSATHIKRATKRTPKASASTAKPEQKPHVKCVADPNMVSAITSYLYTRPDILPKLANPKKSVEGCCNYIIGKMKKIAEKQRNGASSVGLFQEDSTIFGMAVHYYDETDEDLAKEDEKEDGK